jgi:translation initiation factor 2D
MAIGLVARCSDRLPVYTLWKHPSLLPILTTPEPVIPVLVGGADLMVPGGAQRMP